MKKNPISTTASKNRGFTTGLYQPFGGRFGNTIAVIAGFTLFVALSSLNIFGQVYDGKRRVKENPDRAVHNTLTEEDVKTVNTLSPSVADAVRNLPGCTNNTLQPNDDGSTPAIILPFSLNFFGALFTQTYVNNNGNITFLEPLAAFTPFGLPATETPIIAPFFADVDTRGVGSGVVQYGTTTLDARQAFCVNYVNVGYFSEHVDKLNSFQVILIDRSNTGPGNFDIEFNYNQIRWETGDASGGTGGTGGSSARAGYANGSAEIGTWFEFPGSAVNGALLDTNSATGLTNGSLNSSVRGRYIFPVRGGVVSVQPIVFVSNRTGDTEIYKMDLDGLNQARLTFAPGLDELPNWSPDGTKIVFSSTRDGNAEIYVMNSDGSNQTRLTNNLLTDTHPSWSPDGSKIVFTCSRAHPSNGIPLNQEICVINANGTNETQLTFDAGTDDQAQWSPNGYRIAFVSQRAQPGNTDIYLMNTDGTNLTRLTNTPGDDIDPDWSPNGSQIFFTSRATGNYELYKMFANGTSQIQMTVFPSGHDAQPTHSSAGGKVAFTRGLDNNTNYEIFTMNVDGTDFQQLTDTAGTDAQPDWRNGPALLNRTRFDFDGDDRVDVSVWRPEDSHWHISRSTAGNQSISWGLNTDRLVAADYDGDDKTDVAVWRPSNGTWYVLNSNSSTYSSYTWGVSGDIPVPAYYDGDDKTDVGIWRPSTGQWFILNSNGGSYSIYTWGESGDVPVVGDFDGDARADISVFRGGNWYILNSGSGSHSTYTWGAPGDRVVNADYDGDGIDDVAIWRPSDGKWHIRRSANGVHLSAVWGSSGDIPVPGDYDGDDKADIGVVRNGVWYINQSTAGYRTATWGVGTDIAIPGRY